MINQPEIETVTLSRETQDLLTVAEGFLTNAWGILANEIGILPTVRHDLSPSTKAQLGELATRLIPDHGYYKKLPE